MLTLRKFCLAIFPSSVSFLLSSLAQAALIFLESVKEGYKNELSKANDPKNKNKDLKGFANKILEEINKYKWKISSEFMEELNNIKAS